MQLLSLTLVNFRNYEEAHFDFSPSLNEFYGDNAQGKSNLLEAIHLLITGRSFRGANLSHMIRWGSKGFALKAAFLKHGVAQSLEITYDGAQRHILHNATPYTSFAHLLGELRGVLFHPLDSTLVTGPPTTRRRFIDLHLSTINPLYLAHLSRYTKAMQQRNATLKSRELSGIESWEHEMALSAAYLTRTRVAFMAEIQPQVTAIATLLSQGIDTLTLSFRSNLPLPQDIASAPLEELYRTGYSRTRNRDLLLCHTSLGPHRDDFNLHLCNRELRLYGSEGQIRCASMSLRLTEWHHLHSLSGAPPLKLIDDIGAHLDPKRKAQLHETLATSGQAFLTAPEPLTLYPSVTTSRRFAIESGRVF